MNNWETGRIYCLSCGQWSLQTDHPNCFESQNSGWVLLDIYAAQARCTKCGQVWPLKSISYICSHCHKEQKVEYTDSNAIMEGTDRIVKYEGDIIYGTMRQGILLIGQRKWADLVSGP